MGLIGPIRPISPPPEHTKKAHPKVDLFLTERTGGADGVALRAMPVSGFAEIRKVAKLPPHCPSGQTNFARDARP
jgi:hypothetical protein